MSARVSAIYAGPVMHRRIAPRKHALRYSIFTLLLDLDEIDDLSREIAIFSRNRLNLVGFYDRDYGDGSARPLREQVAGLLAEAKIAADGPVRLMCMPRILGYVFNPLSVYFCYRGDGGLAAIVYEVSNTFGERHSYVIPVRPQQGAEIDQNCAKQFYVSPFMDMDMSYAFRIAGPCEKLAIGIIGRQGTQPLLMASFCAARRDLDTRGLIETVASHPLMTLKVTAGIHYEALKLWWKGMQLRPRPPAPERSATFVQSDA